MRVHEKKKWEKNKHERNRKNGLRDMNVKFEAAMKAEWNEMVASIHFLCIQIVADSEEKTKSAEKR